MVAFERQGERGNTAVEKARPQWIDVSFLIAGVGCDWYCAFEWFSGMSDSYFHEPGSAPQLEPLLTAIVLLHIETVQENALGGDLLPRCESCFQILMLKR
jgi:hypothetical protein